MLVAITSFVVIKKDGFWNRFTSVQAVLIINDLNQREYASLKHPDGQSGIKFRSKKPIEKCGMRDPSTACRYGREKIVFLGGSFVGQYERAIIDQLKKYKSGFISFSYDLCPFVSEDIWFSNLAECPLINEKRVKIINGFKDKKIFIISAQIAHFYKPKKRTNNPLSDGKRNIREGIILPPAVAWDSYFQRIAELANQGHKVVVIRTVPSAKIDGKSWIAANANLIPKMKFPNLRNDSDPKLIKAHDESRYPNNLGANVIYIDPSDFLCKIEVSNETGVCFDVMDGLGPIYNGKPHLSYNGASLIAKGIEKRLIEKGWTDDILKEQ